MNVFFFSPPFLSDKAQRRDRVSICNLHMCVRQKGENGSRNQTRSFPAGPAPKLDMPTSNRNFEALNGTDCCLLFGPRSLGQPFSEGDKWNEIKNSHWVTSVLFKSRNTIFAMSCDVAKIKWNLWLNKRQKLSDQWEVKCPRMTRNVRDATTKHAAAMCWAEATCVVRNKVARVPPRVVKISPSRHSTRARWQLQTSSSKPSKLLLRDLYRLRTLTAS